MDILNARAETAHPTSLLTSAMRAQVLAQFRTDLAAAERELRGLRRRAGNPERTHRIGTLALRAENLREAIAELGGRV